MPGVVHLPRHRRTVCGGRRAVGAGRGAGRETRRESRPSPQPWRRRRGAAPAFRAGCADGEARYKPSMRRRIVLDTDMGSDVDDALCLALALAAPELELVAVTHVCGDTRLRAQISQPTARPGRPRRRAGLRRPRPAARPAAIASSGSATRASASSTAPRRAVPDDDAVDVLCRSFRDHDRPRAGRRRPAHQRRRGAGGRPGARRPHPPAHADGRLPARRDATAASASRPPTTTTCAPIPTRRTACSPPASRPA